MFYSQIPALQHDLSNSNLCLSKITIHIMNFQDCLGVLDITNINSVNAKGLCYYLTQKENKEKKSKERKHPKMLAILIWGSGGGAGGHVRSDVSPHFYYFLHVPNFLWWACITLLVNNLIKYKACNIFIIMKVKVYSLKRIKGKYLSFGRIICQDIKQLIKYFEPGKIAGGRSGNTRLVCRSKTLTRS